MTRLFAHSFFFLSFLNAELKTTEGVPTAEKVASVLERTEHKIRHWVNVRLFLSPLYPLTPSI